MGWRSLKVKMASRWVGLAVAGLLAAMVAGAAPGVSLADDATPAAPAAAPSAASPSAAAPATPPPAAAPSAAPAATPAQSPPPQPPASAVQTPSAPTPAPAPAPATQGAGAQQQPPASAAQPPSPAAAPPPTQTVTPPAPAPSAPAPSPQPPAAAGAPPPGAPDAGKPKADSSTGDTVDLAQRPFAFVEGKADRDEVYAAIQGSLGVVKREMDKAGAKASGRPLAVFLDADNTGFRYRAGYPIEAAPEGKTALTDTVKIGVTPSGKAMRFQHLGPYSEIDGTYDAVTAYLDEKGIDAQDSFVEEYANDVKDAEDPNLEVNIYVLLK